MRKRSILTTGEEFDKLEKMFDGVDQRLDRLESDVGTLKSDVGILKSDVGTLKSDVGTLKSDVAVLKVKVERVDNNLQNLTDGLVEWKSELFDKIDGLAGEIRDSRDFREITTGQIAEDRQRMDRLEKKVLGTIVAT